MIMKKVRLRHSDSLYLKQLDISVVPDWGIYVPVMGVMLMRR